MKFPGFTATASLYRTGRVYQGAAASAGTVLSGEPVVPAYYPGPGTQASCSNCLEGCATALAECSAAATALLAGCLFPPACAAAAAAAGAALGACDTANLICTGRCEILRCCPKVCGFPNPLNPGEGCCDADEHCVDQSDPNARDGCCPSSQNVCGGKCCAPGETVCCGDACCPAGSTCCGSTCCPAGSSCVNGVCCPPPYHVCGNTCCPPFNRCCNGQCCKSAYQICDPKLGTCVNPPRRPSFCRAGWTECFGQCCPPGKTCCYGGCHEPYECIH
jgi:hypothetical protein